MDRGRMDTKTREVVLTTLLDIEKNHTFSNIALGTALRANQFMSKQDRAYITRMVEGVTEQRIKLDYIINQFSKTKVNKCKPLIRCVLRMGTYELFFMDSVPDSAACNLSVKLAVDHGFGSLRGFVNGVLRNIARNRDGIKYLIRTHHLWNTIRLNIQFLWSLWRYCCRTMTAKRWTGYSEAATKCVRHP